MILTKQLEEIAERIAAVPVFGVDISDESIKYIRFQSKRSGYVLRDHGVLPLDPGVVVNGEIKNEVALATVLKHAPFSRGFGVGTFVVASLPEEKSFVRIAQIPHVKSAQLRNAVLWELADTLPLPLEEVYFDYEVVPEPHPKDHLDVLTITFPRVVVDTYLRAFRAAGIIPMAFELESQAIARALSDRSRVLEPSLIIDIGKNRSSFVLMYNGSIALTSTIPFSGTVMHQALAKELSVDIGAAEALKKEAGLRTDLHEGKVATVLSNALSPLVDEIEKHTEYYRDHLAPRD